MTAAARRTILGLGGVAGLSLLLAGCGDTDRLAAGTAVLSTDPLPARIPALTPPLDLAHRIELPGIAYRLDRSLLLDAIAPDLALRIGLPAPAGADLDATAWRPADGEKLLVATVVSEAPLLMVEGSPPRAAITDHVLIGGQEVPGVLGPLGVMLPPLGRGRKTLVACVPADLAPADVVLEVRCGERVQQLSLLDGTRIAGDLDHWYTRSAEVSLEPVFWERFGEAPLPDGLVLAGCVLGGRVHLTRQDGSWPEPGTVLLAVHLTTLEPQPGTAETSTIALRLPDGTVLDPVGDPAATFASQGVERAWFEVPADLDTATALITLRLAAGKKTVQLGEVEAPLTMVRRDR